jgi:uncharacterized membrane protein YfcA
MPDLMLVALASLMAGFVDAIIGGGGLVLLPAMFSVYPQLAPAQLLGTNKAAAVWGTALATLQYARRVQMPWGAVLPALPAALAGSALGAWVVTQIDPSGLKKALPVLLALVLGYTLMRKDLGQQHAPRWAGRRQAAAAAGIGLVVGFYDGVFGPGTGSFFVFAMVRLLGWDFLHASAGAKLLNTATNSSALVLFALAGHVWWHLAVVLAVANMAGSLLGTRLALRHGSALIRRFFIGVVSLLILKTGYDAWIA